MKKIIAILLIGIMVINLYACGNKEVEEDLNIEPQIMQMQAICELATMDCYYHTVSKYFEEDVEGALWWKKNRHFWVEFSGIVTIGVDVSKVEMELTEDVVTITLPAAKVLDCVVDQDTLNKDSFIYAKDSAEGDAQSEAAALASAKEFMLQSASGDDALLANGQLRAQKLLEDYVNNIGQMMGKQYQIKWVYVDENGIPTEGTQMKETETSSESAE